MFRLGNKDRAKHRPIRRKEKKRNIRENVLSLLEIEKHLLSSTSYLGAIYVSSFKSIIVKSLCFSFLVYCNNHWFVIYCCKDNVEIFDSVGFLKTKQCATANLLKFLSNQIGCKNLKASRTLQPTHSKLCGIYALYYIIMRDKGNSFEQIMDTFTYDLANNDNLMLRFFNKING